MNIFPKTLFHTTSKVNGEIRVVEGFGERRLIASSFTQSRSLNREGKTGSYWDFFVKNLPDLGRDSRILILGLAAGTIAKLLTDKLGNITIDGVEIDPKMVEIGREYFDFKEKNVNVIIADALKFVKEARFKYDLICIDLFAHGDSPIGTESRDFFEDVKKLMSNDCVVIINKLFTTKEEVDDYLQFLKEVFAETQVEYIRETFHCDNVIIYAKK